MKLAEQQLEPGTPFKANNFEDLKRADLFGRLAAWRISLAAEAASIKEWDCTGEQAAAQAVAMVRHVVAAGGSIEFVAMDEPLASGMGPCHLPPGDVANRLAAYEQTVRQVAGDERGVPLKIGDIEPYPRFSVQTLEDWTSEVAAHGAKLDFFHLDVDVHYVDLHPEIKMEKDVADLNSFFRSAHIPFGIIFWSGYDPLNSDKSYYDHTMAYIERIQHAIGSPDQIVFQSWVTRSSNSCAGSTSSCDAASCSPKDPPYCGEKSIPLNLPDTDLTKFSHTRLIVDGLATLKRADPKK